MFINSSTLNVSSEDLMLTGVSNSTQDRVQTRPEKYINIILTHTKTFNSRASDTDFAIFVTFGE